jgi:hypothetical protein
MTAWYQKDRFGARFLLNCLALIIRAKAFYPAGEDPRIGVNVNNGNGPSKVPFDAISVDPRKSEAGESVIWVLTLPI